MWVKNQEYIRKLQGGIKKAMGEIAASEKSNLRRTIDTAYPPSSEPGTPPHLRTGNLHDSIDAKVTQASAVRVAITFSADAEYAEYLEFGTEHMAARPFLRPHRTRFAKRFIGKLTQALAKGG